MTVRTITDFGELMRLAHALGQAKKRGNQEEIAKAQKEHDEYHALCLKADEMRIGMRFGDLL